MLVLPDMGHFVNEQTLALQALQAPVRHAAQLLAEVDVAVRRHHVVLALPGDIVLVAQADRGIVDGIAEYAFRQADFPFAESTSGLGVGATQELADCNRRANRRCYPGNCGGGRFRVFHIDLGDVHRILLQ